MRFGDLRLRSKGKTQKTWLDDYEFKEQKVEEQENKFDDEKNRMRKIATERGREKVLSIVKKSIEKQFAKYDPYDIKPILHPVDFVVFDGLNKLILNNVILLSRRSTNSNIQALQNSMVKVIDNKQYDWKMASVSEDGKVELE